MVFSVRLLRPLQVNALARADHRGFLRGVNRGPYLFGRQLLGAVQLLLRTEVVAEKTLFDLHVGGGGDRDGGGGQVLGFGVEIGGLETVDLDGFGGCFAGNLLDEF